MKIGLISDTHGFLDEKVFSYFEECDEIWHAGDIGALDVANRLKSFRTLRAVHGNIDHPEIRNGYPENERFEVEGQRVWMTHIGGVPPRYNAIVRESLMQNAPHIFICGHSHILKIMTDRNLNNMLFINPGAAGKQGLHKMRTIIRFELTARKIDNMQVIELGKRGV